MNWDRFEGNWQQFKGKAREQWGKLADDQVDIIAGKRDQLVGAIQKTYGIARDEAEERVKEWEKRCARTFDKDDKSARGDEDRVERVGR